MLFVIVTLVNGLTSTFSIGTTALVITHFVTNLPRNTFFNATALVTGALTSGNGRTRTMSMVIANRAMTGVLNMPTNALVTRFLS